MFNNHSSLPHSKCCFCNWRCADKNRSKLGIAKMPFIFTIECYAFFFSRKTLFPLHFILLVCYFLLHSVILVFSFLSCLLFSPLPLLSLIFLPFFFLPCFFFVLYLSSSALSLFFSHLFMYQCSPYVVPHFSYSLHSIPDFNFFFQFSCDRRECL